MPDPSCTSKRAGRWQVRRFAEIDSTNRYLLDEARVGAGAGLVVVADHQTAGRGRFDRRWVAPPGSSLLVSVLLRPVAASVDAQSAVMAAALALAGAVEEVAGLAPALKWPNDLVVGERKLAGLLAERQGDALVVGLGCNVSWESFPGDLALSATACNLEVGRPVDRDALLDEFLARLDDELNRLDDVATRYRARLATLGRRVRVSTPRGDVDGHAVDLTGDGALVVRGADGTEHAISAGDVVHLR